MRNILCLLVVGVLIFVLAASYELTVPTTPTTPIPEGAKPGVDGTEDAECWYASNLGRDYKGKVNRTREGLECQRWDRNSTPHHHPYVHSAYRFPEHTVSEAENYCRNPDGEPEGPWCYTKDPQTRWSYCNAPKCTASGPCSPDWEKSLAGTCWRSFNKAKSYYAARQACRAIGAELVILPARKDIIFFAGFAHHFVSGDSCTYRESVTWGASWIGGRLTDGVWIWDGIRQEKIAFTDLTIDFGLLGLSLGYRKCLKRYPSGNWYAEKCGESLPYICERA